MIIAIPKERRAAETRVAATPETVKKLKGLGSNVVVEVGAGGAAHFSDADYQSAGATIAPDAAGALKNADIVLKVRGPQASEIAAMKRGAILASPAPDLDLRPCAPGSCGPVRPCGARADARGPGGVRIGGRDRRVRPRLQAGGADGAGGRHRTTVTLPQRRRRRSTTSRSPTGPSSAPTPARPRPARSPSRRPGSRFLCSIPGHADAGMKGSIAVAGGTRCAGMSPLPSTAGRRPRGGPGRRPERAAIHAPRRDCPGACMPGTVHDIDLPIIEKDITVADGLRRPRLDVRRDGARADASGSTSATRSTST